MDCYVGDLRLVDLWGRLRAERPSPRPELDLWQMSNINDISKGKISRVKPRSRILDRVLGSRISIVTLQGPRRSLRWIF